MERTFVMVKPHAVEWGFVPQIVDRYLREGFSIVGVQVLPLKKEWAEEFYKEHQGRDYFDGLISSMCQGHVVALILEGQDAISRIRLIHGATNPEKAAPGTIRHHFKDVKGRGGPYNTVHASDSPEAVIREIGLIFPLKT